jgi:glutamyl/glutaminyl-tRNA synthetase
MKNGKCGASDATLRLKMDMLSPNPNMWDQVRVLFFSILFFYA